ncbi:MAG: hypothetical protein IID39_10655, partial [Planctomycetes bacterium]|nr:hypothetical protein [Planctomycetota bacterium]
MISPVMNNTRRPTAVCAESPAKINLTLNVLGRRSDGFHEIRSLIVGVDLCDEIHFRSTDAPGISLRCNNPALPVDERNLAVQAAHAVARYLDQ